MSTESDGNRKSGRAGEGITAASSAEGIGGAELNPLHCDLAIACVCVCG